MNKEDTEEISEAQLESALLGGTNNWDSTSIEYFGPYNQAIVISEEITPQVSTGICSQIWHLEQEGAEKAYIYINSPGGSTYDMWAIYDVMRIAPFPIITIGYGIVGSATFLLFQGGDKRVCLPHCQFFYHEPILTMEATQAIAISNSTDLYHATKKEMNAIIKGRSKIPKKIWNELFENNTSRYINAEQALEWGIVDEVITIPNKNKLTNKKWI